MAARRTFTLAARPRAASFVAAGLAGACAAFGLCGCAASPSAGKGAAAAAGGRDPDAPRLAARREDDAAVDAIARGDFARAKTLVRQALIDDPMLGAAHNNLGRVRFHDGDLYAAAWEFQYAAKLLPRQPEPLNNLGLVFERAGRLDEAVGYFQKARDADPANVEYLGNLARAKVRRGDRDGATADLLRELARRDVRPEWVAWARARLEISSHPTTAESP